MKTILIVEDDRLLGKSLRDKLAKENFPVIWAQNSEDAFEALDQEDIGLVYLDVMLPGDMDGFDILRKMKQDEMMKHVPVVILSNLGEIKHIDRAMDLGAKDYIVKITTSLNKLREIAENELNQQSLEANTSEF